MSSKQPEQIEWYLDYQLGGVTVAKALRDHDLIVHPHRDYFAPDAADEEWLMEVGQRRWIVLTKDRNIQRRGPEREALVRANVRAFVLVAKETNGQQNAQILISAHAGMVRHIEEHPAPFIVRVYRDGSLSPVALENLRTPGYRPQRKQE